MMLINKEPKSFLARVFNFKLRRFVVVNIILGIRKRSHLELKTRPRLHPVS
jgi:hypothetical protein